jgi:predicted DNA-binding transcriptional regulator YafY
MYVTSKPIHPLQNVIVRERVVELRVYPNRELKQQIFSFGPDVEVLEPQWLREEIIHNYEDCLKRYVSVQKECTIEE